MSNGVRVGVLINPALMIKHELMGDSSTNKSLNICDPELHGAWPDPIFFGYFQWSNRACSQQGCFHIESLISYC
jgi:hypothetical protein